MAKGDFYLVVNDDNDDHKICYTEADAIREAMQEPTAILHIMADGIWRDAMEDLAAASYAEQGAQGIYPMVFVRQFDAEMLSQWRSVQGLDLAW